MLHAYAARFDVMENLKNFAKFFGTKQGLSAQHLVFFAGIST
jgi:hypothetical protein